ncbi:MAG: bifunctional glutamate N-acetyltransferase/amino-acid acetyltransferase ArgJ [Candidatus Omnitrophica bacterium]|nr:bifunctional glutamate N-acetyltransferase/amino-acid acetyltransferase ArgJ [Candidatus Omnitrophota bacterium]
MKFVSGGVTLPVGFKAAGIHCGIKKRKLDLGILRSDYPAKSAGVFTTNKLKAPHIELDKEHIRKGKIRALLVNSGNANCYNGKRGLDDAKALIQKTSALLKVNKGEVLIASTGVIAKPLPVSLMVGRIPQLIDKLGEDKEGGFAQAILTTDKKVKQAAIEFKIGSKVVRLAGCIKGSGMIQPHMATTLCFLTTDVEISKGALNKALRLAVDESLNLVTVDGDMSPNDSVIILANGRAKNKAIDLHTASFGTFTKALTLILMKLTKMLIEDAEGSTKVITIEVKGAKNRQEARKAGFAVANSNLVKTAFYGQDPNWGRMLSAVGSSGVSLKPREVELSFGGVKVFKNFEPQKIDKRKLENIFRKPEILVTVDLKAGSKSATVLTCDLTKDYISINAHYRT